MPRCRKHSQPDRKTCVVCHVETVSRNAAVDSVRAEEERRIVLATKLALFLGANDVENYVSPAGYKLKIITRRTASAATGTPWHQSRKEDAA